jgi:hypothetical protein
VKYTVIVDTGLSDCLAAREAAVDAAIAIACDLSWVLDAGGTTITVTQSSFKPAIGEIPNVLGEWEIPLTDSSEEGTIGS